MSYKILKQTDKAFEIKHPDGSTFTVPKKGLSKTMMDKIAQMPGFAEGGQIKVEQPQWTDQDKAMIGAIKQDLAAEKKRYVNPSEYPIHAGFLPEEGVTESAISPIDFITPGMVAAPVKAAAKGVSMLGRGAMAVGREAVEAAPRILGNEIGSVGGLAVKPRMVMPGMYSKAEQSISEKMGGSASPQQIMGILKETKPEEVDFLGIPKFLEGKTKVTKDEMLGHIRENLPKIEQKVLGGSKAEEVALIKQQLSEAQSKEYGLAAKGVNQKENVINLIYGTPVDEKTLDDLLYYSNHGGPLYEETRDKALSQVTNPETKAKLQQSLNELRETQKQITETRNGASLLQEKLTPEMMRVSKPKFSSYTEPGGKSYAENLYTIQPKEMAEVQKLKNVIGEKYGPQLDKAYDEYKASQANAGNVGGYANYVEKRDAFERLQTAQRIELEAAEAKLPEYKTHHFPESNILAHSRTKIRTGPNGEKHLFAEEIQSDWHQAGRSKGYRIESIEDIQKQIDQKRSKILEISKSRDSDFSAMDKFLTKKYGDDWIVNHNLLNDSDFEMFTAFSKKYPEIDKLKTEVAELRKQQDMFSSQVPNAPMKKTWHEFVSKRLLHDAAESGADNVSWTTGAQQAERYNLAKQVDHLEMRPIEDGTYDIIAKKDGRLVATQNVSSIKEAEPIIGKEVTKKFNEQLEQGVKAPKLIGEQLQIGGEGMKGFYDKIIPDYMNKLGKKYGVKVETATLPEAGQVHTMKLTPEMKQDILKKGFPLFTGVAAIGAQKSEAKEPKGLYNGGKGGDKMGYKIIKDAEDHYQVMHPDGSKFTVPKKGISKQMHDKIMGMPKFYDGGLLSEEQRAEMAALPKREYPTPFDSEIESIQNQLNSDATLSSEVAVPLAQKLGQLKNIQSAIVDVKRRPVTGLPAHYDFSKAHQQQMTAQEGAPLRQPAVDEEEPAEPVMQPSVPQVPQPAAAPQTGYDSMFQTMGGRLAAPAQALSRAENEYKMKTLMAQNEAEVRQQEMNDYIKSADDEAASFAEKNRVDPSRYWSSMDTGNKIQAALAIALGGIGAGLTGGENQALKIINKAIDADIDAQKENRNSLYNIMLSKHKRHEMALSAAKGDALQKVQNALNTFTVQAKSAEAQQSAAKLANDLELQKIAYKDYFQKKNAGDYLSYQAQNGATLTPNEIEVLPKEKRERLVNGAGFASNMESAKKIREAKADVMGIENDIERLLQIRRQYGSEVFPTEVAKEARALAMGIQAKLRVPILGPGTVNDTEREMLQDLMNTDPTRFFSTDAVVQTQLQTVMGMAQRNFDNMLKAEGIGVKPRPTRMENAPGMQQGLMLNK